MALQQVGQQDEAKARDDKALIKDRDEDAEIELNGLGFKSALRAKNRGKLGADCQMRTFPGCMFWVSRLR